MFLLFSCCMSQTGIVLRAPEFQEQSPGHVSATQTVLEEDHLPTHISPRVLYIIFSKQHQKKGVLCYSKILIYQNLIICCGCSIDV